MKLNLSGAEASPMAVRGVYSAFCYGFEKDIAWESIQVALSRPPTEY